MAGDPSVLRRYTAYCDVAVPDDTSLISRVRPSAERSVSMDPSSHDRSRSLSPAELTALIRRRHLPSFSSTRPLRSMSWIVIRLADRKIVRTRRARLTASREAVAPNSAALNQIASPSGDHARPVTLAQGPDSARRVPPRLTIADTVPRSS